MLASPNCLAVDPNFNGLLPGGTIAVDGLFLGGSCVWYDTWQSPLLGWSGAWTAVLSNLAELPDCLALMYAPTSILRLISVQNDLADGHTYGVEVPVGGEAYSVDVNAAGSTSGLWVLWVNLGLALILGIGGGILGLRRLKIL